METVFVTNKGLSRSPHGERGLKCMGIHHRYFRFESLPPRGAWIEIAGEGLANNYMASRSPHGERGLKCDAYGMISEVAGSLPPRGAWIEIDVQSGVTRWTIVAPPTGSVD